MKIMKSKIKLLALLSIFLLSLTTAKAQIGKLKYRAEAGVTYSKIYHFLSGDPLIGMRLSGQVLLPFEHTNFALVSGLTLTNKGERIKNSKHKVGMMYLQIPLEASMKMSFRDNEFYLATGPFVGFNLSSKGGDLEGLYKIQSESPFKPFEFGWGINAMYAYHGIYLRAGIDMSISDVANQKCPEVKNLIEYNTTRRNGLVYMTIGYQF